MTSQKRSIPGRDSSPWDMPEMPWGRSMASVKSSSALTLLVLWCLWMPSIMRLTAQSMSGHSIRTFLCAHPTSFSLLTRECSRANENISRVCDLTRSVQPQKTFLTAGRLARRITNLWQVLPPLWNIWLSWARDLFRAPSIDEGNL